MIVKPQVAHFPSIQLDSRETLFEVDVAYETYGDLSPERDNGVLVLHAFSGDAHAAGISEEDGKPGWWDNMVGPGRGFDTNHYCVISSNVLGGCRGTTGPSSANPVTGKPYGSSFPFLTIGDMVRLQKMLIEHLGIKKLLAIVGGSMGGMQVLQWVVDYPESVASAIPIATTLQHSAQQIAFNEVGRQAIMADPDWNGGDYYSGPGPMRGLAVARMIGHITYMSDESMREKFGRRRRKARTPEDEFAGLFEVESYLRYRGGQFVNRFDANSYLTITRAMDSIDLSAGYHSFGEALARSDARYLVISFTSDWLYPSYQSQQIVRTLRSRNLDVAYVELPSNHGHDAFLLEVDELKELMKHFLENTFRLLGRERCKRT